MIDDRRLYTVLQLPKADDVMAEVKTILLMISSEFDIRPIEKAFRFTLDLFKGDIQGYRACNTRYHDIDHTLEVFLATARIIHGATIDGTIFKDEEILTCLIAALFHDTGYIQTEDDVNGTGAKYTENHERRSMVFLGGFAGAHGLKGSAVQNGQHMILCTDMRVDIDSIHFETPGVALLAEILTVSDILAQMADRAYLEKLLYLYEEFMEAGIHFFESETDLIRRTVDFYDFIASRLERLQSGMNRFLYLHFNSRWNMAKNLYDIAMHKHINYLKSIVDLDDDELLGQLKRQGIVEKYMGNKNNQ